MKNDWRQVILYITALGMEGCWLYALMSLLNDRAAGGALSVFIVMLLYPVSFVINKLLRQLKWAEFGRRAIRWLLWAAVMLLAVKIQLFSSTPWSDTQWLLAIPRAIADIFYNFRPELLILISSAIIWWMGNRLANLKARFALMVGEFQFGLIILLFTFFLASQLEIEIAGSFPLTMSFFLLALIGIPVAHTLEGESWLSGLYRVQWSGLLLTGIGLVILVGLLISWIVTPDFLQIIVGGVKWVWGLIMKALLFIMSLFPEPEPAELPPEMPMPRMEAPEEGIEKFLRLPEWLRSGLGMGIIAIWAGLTILALWRISSEVFSWMRRRLASTAGGEYESVPATFGADLMKFIKRIIRGLLKIRQIFYFRRKSVIMLPDVAPVRQTYRQFLRWAARAGYTRSLAQTPHEFLYLLVNRLPELQPDIAYITEQYVAVRYGNLSPDEDAIHYLKQSWQRVKKTRLRKRGGSQAPPGRR